MCGVRLCSRWLGWVCLSSGGVAFKWSALGSLLYLLVEKDAEAAKNLCAWPKKALTKIADKAYVLYNYYYNNT